MRLVKKGKMKRSSHKSKEFSSITAPLQLIHVDLFDPINVMSLSKKKYALVMMDDFSRHTWVKFLHSKYEAPQIIIDHLTQIENIAEANVVALKSYNWTEFKNALLEDFCKENDISQQFFSPRTPHQNGVVERKNITIIEATRTMLQDANLPTSFWAEAINTACYIQNKTLINKSVGNTPYFIMRGRKPTVKHLHVFGSKCFILKYNVEHIGKFDSKAFEVIFLGYSLERTTYRVYVINHQKVIESMNVNIDDNRYPGTDDREENDPLAFENIIDIEEFESEEESQPNKESTNSEGNSGNKDNEEQREELLLENPPFNSCTNLGGVSQGSTPMLVNHLRSTTSKSKETPHTRKWDRDHTTDQLIGNQSVGVKTRSATQNECLYSCFLYQNGHKKIDKALLDPDWIVSMQKELNQFERNKV